MKLILGCLLSIHSKKLLWSYVLTSLNSTLSWDKLCNHWCLWPNHLVIDIYSWTPFFVMIRVISTEHRALNHIPFIYSIFLAPSLCHLMSSFIPLCLRARSDVTPYWYPVLSKYSKIPIISTVPIKRTLSPNQYRPICLHSGWAVLMLKINVVFL